MISLQSKANQAPNDPGFPPMTLQMLTFFITARKDFTINQIKTAKKKGSQQKKKCQNDPLEGSSACCFFFLE